MTTKNPGDVLTSSLWNAQLKANIDKLLNTGHRTLTVAQFAALTGLEGTKGVVAGDEVYLEVDATNGILWHLVYESTEATYKWRYLGGPPMVAEVVTSEATSSAAYAALATAGPSIALPRGGDFDVEVGFNGFANAAVNGFARMSYDIGGTGAVDADSVFIFMNDAGTPRVQSHVWRRRRKTAIAASTTLTAKYKTAAASATFQDRVMLVRPVRLV